MLYGLARSLLTDPLFWVVVMLAVGVVVGRRRPAAGRRWIILGLVSLMLLGWRLPSNAVMHQLETRHLPASEDASTYAGVVVLGGSFESALLQGQRGQVQLNAHADRLTEALALARQYPHLPIIFTGGCVDTGEGCLAEAELARRFFTRLGLAPDRVRYEAASRTTYENALLTAQLPGLDKTQPWLLLTSAWHMPRAMAAFRAQGWNVTPWPVDFRGSDQTPWLAYSLTRGVQQWQFALHECLGLLTYWVTGRAAL